MKILILDNFDSFTYNLYQYVGDVCTLKNISFSVDVIRNNEITHEEILKRNYDRIILSPGPGDPSDKKYFGVCAEVLTKCTKESAPVIGVCLGMQGMAHYFGGKVVRAKEPMHGKTSTITHDGKGLFANIPQEVAVMRYHSLVAEESSLPECLEVTARVKDTGEIMGLRHKELPIEGIQFHPESFGTEGGKRMVENILFNTFIK